MAKFKQTRKAKMARRRTITVCVLILLLIGIIIGMVSCIKSHNAKKVAAETAAKAEKTQETSELDMVIQRMSLDQKILQLFLVSPESLTGSSMVTAAGSTTQNAINTYPVGGVYFSSSNMLSQDQFKEMITSYQAYIQSAVGIPLFIAVSEEGGDTAPVAGAIGTNTMYSAYHYAGKTDGETSLMSDAQSVASSLAGVGINMNLAPYANASSTSSTTTNTRSFGTDYSEVANLVAAAVTGYKNGGVGSVMKYFPTIGEATSDGTDTTATALASTSKTLEQLEAEDMKPFASGITAGATAIMVGHISVDTVEKGVPASLSQKVVQNIIRTGMGFEGLIMTDALTDNAITNSYSSAEAAVAAIQAGNDIIFEPQSISEALQGIKDAITAGTLKESQIDASVKRILQAKIDLGIMTVSADGTLTPVTTTSPAEASSGEDSSADSSQSNTLVGAAAVEATSTSNAVSVTNSINTTIAP